MDKSAIMQGRTAALILYMIKKNSDLGVGGNVKFFYRSEFYTHEHKIPQSEPEYYSLTICF